MFPVYTITSNIEVWIAIIALNLTLIGLSSLAEKRSVIGVEYGKFLLDRYEVGGVFRLYHLLVFVAVSDIWAFAALWFVDCKWLAVTTFCMLCVSTCIVIVYLFVYVLRISKEVKLQIYKNELQGLYVNSNKECDFYGDRIVGMNKGDRTTKKLSSNVLQYFDQYNDETIEAFNELFSPGSIVYERVKFADGKESHDYSVYDKGEDTGLKHISWEFFQMFRYSEIQERWLLEILKIFNLEYSQSFPRLRLYNVARILGQINSVGFSDGLYKYKFLDYLLPYIKDAVDAQGDMDSEMRIKVEKYVYEQLALFMSSTLAAHPSRGYAHSVKKVFEDLLSPCS